MIKLFTRFLKATALLSILPFLVKSQGFQVNVAGQKQISMGGTGTGFVSDGATIFYNPGGMSFLKQNSISLGSSPILLRVAFKSAPPSNNSYHFGTNTPPVQGYAVFGPRSGAFKFGIGIYNPFGGSANWGNGWVGKYALEKLDLKATFIQPTLSIKLSPRIAIGGGFVFGLGYVDLQKAIPLQDSTGTDGQANLTSHASGFGYNLGLYYQATDNFSVGISYRSEVKMKSNNGLANFMVPGSLKSSFPSPNSFTNTLPLPPTITLGFGYRPSKPLILTFDVNYIGWSLYKSLEFDFGQTTPNLPNSISSRNYKDAFDLRLGTNYAFSDQFSLRAGLAYGATSIRDGYVTPETPDANRIGLSTGFGYSFSKHWVIDASFLYESIQSRFQTNIETGLSGTFKSNVYVPGIAITYRF